MTALPGAAQLQSAPTTCLVVTLRRLQTLIKAISMIMDPSAGSSSCRAGRVRYAGPVVGEPGLPLHGQLLRHVRTWSRATTRTSGRRGWRLGRAAGYQSQ